MSAERINLIDSIVIDNAFDICTLNIIDHALWSTDHLDELQAKINNCLQFIESGEIYIAYPDAQGCEFTIHAQFIHEPSDETVLFLTKAQEVLEEAGFTLSYGPLGTDYADE